MAANLTVVQAQELYRIRCACSMKGLKPLKFLIKEYERIHLRDSHLTRKDHKMMIEYFNFLLDMHRHLES